MKNYQTIIMYLFIVFLIMVIYLQLQTLLPFIIAFITAYLLKPLSQLLEQKFQLSKTYIAISVISVFIVIVIILSLVIFPFIYEQIALFIKKFPIYKNMLTKDIIPNIVNKLNTINPDLGEKISMHIQQLADKTLSEAFNILNNIWQYTLSTISFLADVVLVPFILYYFIKDWCIITHTVEDAIPVAYKARYKLLMSEINILLSSYIRGQLNTCMILALYYSSSLSLIGVDFALLLGALSGFLTIIPFVGLTLSLSVSLILTYFSAAGLSTYLYIVLVYLVGHMLDVYVLVPKLVGKSIGLHPVWIMFAILTLGNTCGIIGIIIAIPVAGIVKIILKFAFGYYKNSEIYNSHLLEK